MVQFRLVIWLLCVRVLLCLVMICMCRPQDVKMKERETGCLV